MEDNNLHGRRSKTVQLLKKIKLYTFPSQYREFRTYYPSFKLWKMRGHRKRFMLYIENRLHSLFKFDFWLTGRKTIDWKQHFKGDISIQVFLLKASSTNLWKYRSLNSLSSRYARNFRRTWREIMSHCVTKDRHFYLILKKSVYTLSSWKQSIAPNNTYYIPKLWHFFLLTYIIFVVLLNFKGKKGLSWSFLICSFNFERSSARFKKDKT